MFNHMQSRCLHFLYFDSSSGLQVEGLDQAFRLIIIYKLSGTSETKCRLITWLETRMLVSLWE